MVRLMKFQSRETLFFTSSVGSLGIQTAQEVTQSVQPFIYVVSRANVLHFVPVADIFRRK